MSDSSSPLPSSHPLLAELASLRQQLVQYQKSAHQSARHVQAARHDALRLEEANKLLKDKEASLTEEVEELRKNPPLTPIPPSSTALTELSLAHRRLSAKLDLTEGTLSSTQLELAAANQEIQRLQKEKEHDQGIINELRRVEDDREEEIEWERGERRKAEEQKKLCDLALQEYSTLVHSLDPSSVPPKTPRSSSPNILQSTPELLSPKGPESPVTTPSSTSLHTTSDSISNLLIGQRGVHQLFNDFTSTLAAKEKALHQTQARVEELEQSIEVIKTQLAEETALRVTAQEDKAKAMRDDGSAAKVVERYMTFTQKTHATVHMHLDNLRTRSAATQQSLRSEIGQLRSQLEVEQKRGVQLRAAMDEMSEGYSRETAGRRREVALRLAMLAEEERRERKVEVWLDRVRKMREGAEGAVIEPDVLESLLDEGIEAVVDGIRTEEGEGSRKRSWKGLNWRRKKQQQILPAVINAESSVTRVLLAEELANSLAEDFRLETERRLKLEHERVEWLAREATGGMDPEAYAQSGGRGKLLFEADHDHDQEQDHEDDVQGGGNSQSSPQQAKTDGGRPEEGTTESMGDNSGPNAHETSTLLPPVAGIEPVRTPSPLTDPSPLVGLLKQLFDPLTLALSPLQDSLHDLSHSLSSLRSSLPTTSSSSSSSGPSLSSPSMPKLSPSPTRSRFSDKRAPILNLSLRPRPNADPVLFHVLNSIHEVIEDARVDVEIALADEERVYRGFEALLGVGKSGAVQGKEVMRDAREYIAAQREKDTAGRLKTRVGDIEHDLTTIKSQLHKLEGMDIAPEEGLGDPNDTTSDDKRPPPKPKSIWTALELRTVTPSTSTPRPFPSSPSSLLFDHPSPIDDPRKRTTSLFSSVGNVGRSFSASVIGAPKRMGSFAGGLYPGNATTNGGIKVDGKRMGDKGGAGENQALMDSQAEKSRTMEDDVE